MNRSLHTCTGCHALFLVTPEQAENNWHATGENDIECFCGTFEPVTAEEQLKLFGHSMTVTREQV